MKSKKLEGFVRIKGAEVCDSRDFRAVLARAAQLKKGLGLGIVCETLQKHHGTVARLAVAARKDEKLDSLASRLIDNLV